MSMISAQIDELRSMAESVGLAMPQAATLMMEAADTIWELRCKCAGMVDMRERARLAEAENAKLRGLVRDMYEMAYPEFPSAFEAAFADRMRELSVEVYK